MKNHKLHKVWNQVPVTYYQEGVKNNFFQWLWHTGKINLAQKIIKELKFKNCLDIGTASGYMISEIAKKYPGPNYFGIDVYDKAIDHAKKTYPNIKFKVASAEKLPFKDESFDLILCYETIEHVVSPKASLLEIKRVLKKDGTFILTMDSGNLLFRVVWWIWEKTTGRVWQDAHLHSFHHKELEKLITGNGFKVKKKILSFLGMEVTFVLDKEGGDGDHSCKRHHDGDEPSQKSNDGMIYPLTHHPFIAGKQHNQNQYDRSHQSVSDSRIN